MAFIDELAAREAAMRWLDDRTQLGTRTVTQPDVANFPFQGQDVALLLRQQGICKPRQLDAALSIRTTWTRPGDKPPYEDVEGPDGLVRYAYRGTDPEFFENRALRRAFEHRLPMIWFVAVAPGVYLARYPVYVVADEPEHLRVALAIDEDQRFLGVPRPDEIDRRRSVQRLTKLRLHQPVFRAQVLGAYERSCAMCRLRHVELLDAAHIIPDGKERGTPIVPNGLSLCSIHHRAFDANVLGVRPDYTVAVRSDILGEIDGPMLKHGLQAMDGVSLSLPKQRAQHPDRERVEERYEEFLAAG
ncbi:HNH endonuclease [Actinomycetospora chlora]|uniref:HNH endonuclease n=1 Tax=Actinomycetospora chlora TaxID=663608 RepID=A0ABP9AQT6_9PSEU